MVKRIQREVTLNVRYKHSECESWNMLCARFYYRCPCILYDNWYNFLEWEITQCVCWKGSMVIPFIRRWQYFIQVGMGNI